MRRWLALAYGLLGACGTESNSGLIHRPHVESAVAESPTAGTAIDSALPIAEHLRRFRVSLDSTPRLDGASATPSELARRFLQAVAARDTVDLARMVLSPREFAWVYYPSHIYYAPPYELDPGTFWTLIQGNSEKGFVRVMRRYGGRQLTFHALRCETGRNVLPPLREAERCTLEFAADGRSESRRMFGSIVGDGAAFKFVSYANEF